MAGTTRRTDNRSIGQFLLEAGMSTIASAAYPGLSKYMNFDSSRIKERDSDKASKSVEEKENQSSGKRNTNYMTNQLVIDSLDSIDSTLKLQNIILTESLTVQNQTTRLLQQLMGSGGGGFGGGGGGGGFGGGGLGGIAGGLETAAEGGAGAAILNFLKNGIGKIASGAGRLASGAGRLASGAGELALANPEITAIVAAAVAGVMLDRKIIEDSKDPTKTRSQDTEAEINRIREHLKMNPTDPDAKKQLEALEKLNKNLEKQKAYENLPTLEDQMKKKDQSSTITLPTFDISGKIPQGSAKPLLGQGSTAYPSTLVPGSGPTADQRAQDGTLGRPAGGGGTEEGRPHTRLRDGPPNEKEGTTYKGLPTGNGSVASTIFGGEEGRSSPDYNIYNSSGGRHSGHMDFSKMSLGEVMAAQSQGQIFAAGAYQIIPNTLRGAAASLHLDPNEKFDKSLQDRIFSEYLATSKKGRGPIEDYIKGRSDNADAALKATAQEWASVQYHGRGIYDKDGINHASISDAKMLDALEKARTAYKENGGNYQKALFGITTQKDDNLQVNKVAEQPETTGTPKAVDAGSNIQGQSKGIITDSALKILDGVVNDPPGMTNRGMNAATRRANAITAAQSGGVQPWANVGDNPYAPSDLTPGKTAADKQAGIDFYGPSDLNKDYTPKQPEYQMDYMVEIQNEMKKIQDHGFHHVGDGITKLTDTAVKTLTDLRDRNLGEGYGRPKPSKMPYSDEEETAAQVKARRKAEADIPAADSEEAAAHHHRRQHGRHARRKQGFETPAPKLNHISHLHDMGVTKETLHDRAEAGTHSQAITRQVASSDFDEGGVQPWANDGDRPSSQSRNIPFSDLATEFDQSSSTTPKSLPSRPVTGLRGLKDRQKVQNYLDQQNDQGVQDQLDADIAKMHAEMNRNTQIQAMRPDISNLMVQKTAEATIQDRLRMNKPPLVQQFNSKTDGTNALTAIPKSDRLSSKSIGAVAPPDQRLNELFTSVNGGGQGGIGHM